MMFFGSTFYRDTVYIYEIFAIGLKCVLQEGKLYKCKMKIKIVYDDDVLEKIVTVL